MLSKEEVIEGSPSSNSRKKAASNHWSSRDWNRRNEWFCKWSPINQRFCLWRRQDFDNMQADFGNSESLFLRNERQDKKVFALGKHEFTKKVLLPKEEEASLIFHGKILNNIEFSYTKMGALEQCSPTACFTGFSLFQFKADTRRKTVSVKKAFILCLFLPKTSYALGSDLPQYKLKLGEVPRF